MATIAFRRAGLNEFSPPLRSALLQAPERMREMDPLSAPDSNPGGMFISRSDAAQAATDAAFLDAVQRDKRKRQPGEFGLGLGASLAQQGGNSNSHGNAPNTGSYNGAGHSHSSSNGGGGAPMDYSAGSGAAARSASPRPSLQSVLLTMASDPTTQGLSPQTRARLLKNVTDASSRISVSSSGHATAYPSSRVPLGQQGMTYSTGMGPVCACVCVSW